MSFALNKAAQAGAAAFMLLILSACASYNLGPGAEVPFKTLYVQPVINDSFAPQTQGILSNHLAQTFIKDGRVSLVGDPDKADAILTVTLVNFYRDPNAVSAIDTGRARSFSLQLTASCTLHDRKNNSTYFSDREISANVYSFTDSGLQSAEFQDMPKLTERLAQRIADSTLGTW